MATSLAAPSPFTSVRRVITLCTCFWCASMFGNPPTVLFAQLPPPPEENFGINTPASPALSPTGKAGFGFSAESARALSILKQFDAAFSAIFEIASPSVVVIRVDKEEVDARDFDQGIDPEGFGFGPLQNEGSGFILDNEGHIATNLHVIEGAKKIRVKLKDEREFQATQVGVDDKTDIAIIKISATGLVPSQMGNSDQLRVGQLVATIGAPYNLDYSFTLGIISGLGRTNLNVAAFEEYIQTDASINPGNSGGPLLDVEGRVIGMTTLVNGINRGLGFAIPINMVQEVAAELIEKGRVIRPWLGIGIDNYSETSSKATGSKELTRGVVVRSVAIESPAYATDLRAGDVIVAVDGKPVATTRELQKLVLSKKIGEPILLTVNRKGKILGITMKTDELPTTRKVETAPKGKIPTPEEKENPRNRLVKPEKSSTEITIPPPNASGFVRIAAPESAGLEVERLPVADAAKLGLPDSQGLRVTAVKPEGPAAKANLAKGDVIVAVGASPIGEPEEFWRLLSAEAKNGGATLTVVRGGQRGVTRLIFPSAQ